MLQVKRDNTKAVIVISTDLPFDCKGTSTSTLSFSFEMGDPSWAELLTRYMHDRLSKEIRKALHDAYEQGWKDAKSHKTKENWFRDWL